MAYYSPRNTPKGLVILVHGWNDHHDSPLMSLIVSTYVEAGYSVLTWDATGSAGQSGGMAGSAKFSTYYKDMLSVMTWAVSKSWYEPSFILVGHSLGGAIAASYAARYPEKVDRLVLLSTYVAGRLSLAHITRIKYLKIAFKGIFMSYQKPHRNQRFQMLKEAVAMDIRRLASSLSMPSYLIVGALDRHTTVDQVSQLASRLPNLNMFEIVPNTGHIFRSEGAKAMLKNFLIKTLV